MNSTEIAVLVLFSIFGFFNMLIGNIIKKKKYVEIISGYDPKYDDKDYIANLFGTNMFILGCIEIFTSIIYTAIILLSEDKNMPIYFTIANLLMLFFICFKMYYNMSKDRKRRRKNV
ncbi:MULTISPECIES: hypothetical protein [Clostridiaceae]|uniref:DUF3784 domain-containing protein n=1 Tax=Caloramator proteoclasticus DSM 10124 TaxID=1121262 RepID=A0A1M4X9T9_9CLOT|nr:MULTISPECIES: hypothetical protein [Clostridiaceae]SHE90233.1 hypothetical protein SAMN02746091_01361 [Caloramator proteoclasticus DSM 10124]